MPPDAKEGTAPGSVPINMRVTTAVGGPLLHTGAAADPSLLIRKGPQVVRSLPRRADRA